MLVLQRRLGERLLIGDDIVITVTEIKDGRVKLGVEAPRHLRIDRQEVREAIQRDRKAQGEA